MALMKYRVRQKKPRGENARLLLIAEVDRAFALLGDAAANARAMHDARKHLKRMRALLNLTAPCFGSNARAESRRIRGTARILARHRELDALRKLVEREFVQSDRAVFEGLLGTRERPGTPAAIARSRDIATSRRTLMAIRRRAKRIDVEETTRSEIERRFRRTYKKARDAFWFACENRADQPMHEWRKRQKRLLNQARLLGSWGTPAFGPFGRELKALDDTLGKARDFRILAVLTQRRLEGDGSDAKLRATLKRLQAASVRLIDQAVRQGEGLFAVTPREFVARMIR